MDAYGAAFRAGDEPVDPSVPFKKGGNLVRMSIRNHTDWTRYSDYGDALKTICRAYTDGPKVLPDFHHSDDDGADGDEQVAPADWGQANTASPMKRFFWFQRSKHSILGRPDPDLHPPSRHD